MARFIKKPVEVEAEQYSRERHINSGYLPRGLERRRITLEDGSTCEGSPVYRTIHRGIIFAYDGEWVILESDGIHAYPCKPDIFAETYEPVD